jgi:hypothetical protein
MIAIKIYKNKIQTNEGRFNTEQEAISWLEMGESSGWWKTQETQETIPAVTQMQEVDIQPEIKDEEGNVIQERIVEMQEVVVEPEKVITHPATHTYEIIDITDEVNREQALVRRMRLRGYGERLIDEMSVKNAELGLSLEQLKAIMLDQDAVLVRELLWTGALESAKAVIEEKRSKFEAMMGEEYVGWVLQKIDEVIGAPQDET